MSTVALLTISNVIITFAWYADRKFRDLPLWLVVLAGWGIAFFQCILMVPAMRPGATAGWTGFQLKITQEVITLAVFSVFAVYYLRERLQWNHALAFACLMGAVFFTFGLKAR